jgi:hypothetical protein
MAERQFKIVLEGHLDEKKLRDFCLKHHAAAVEASRGLITSAAPEGDVEYLLGYAARCFAGDISHDYSEESSIEEIEGWPYVDASTPEYTMGLWEGWKIIEPKGIAQHPATIAIELNGNRAIAFFDDMDFSSYFRLYENETDDDGKDAKDIEEAITFHTGKDAEFHGETILSQRQGSIAIWTSTVYPGLEVTLDTKTGNVVLKQES